MNANDFRRIALSLEGAEESSHHGCGGFPGGRQDICDAGVGEAGLWQPDADTGATEGICGRASGSIPSHCGRMGKDGDDAHPDGSGERGRDDRSVADSVETARREERKVGQENQRQAKEDAGSEDPPQEALTRQIRNRVNKQKTWGEAGGATQKRGRNKATGSWRGTSQNRQPLIRRKILQYCYYYYIDTIPKTGFVRKFIF